MDMKEWLYVLDGHNVRATDDMAEWGRCFDSPDRIVAHTTDEFYEVSTVFLGVRHNHLRPGPPILFETMVFTTEAYASSCPKGSHSTTSRFDMPHGTMPRPDTTR